ncbi:MAG: hypothetical protein Fur005_21020 [Roseiflexaceae bacterium]
MTLPDPSTLLGEMVVQLERCRWGFTNDTAVATLRSGRRVILQRVAQPDRAALIAHSTSLLPPRLNDYGILAPMLLDADLQASPPFIVRSYIPGDTSNQWLATLKTALRLAHQSGALLERLATVPIDNIPLDTTWASPTTLAEAAQGWLAQARTLIPTTQQRLIEHTLPALEAVWPLDPACLAHGDFCPVNLICANEHIIALVDFEWARIASPTFDLAWWGWVVRYHHPERWQAIWPSFLQAAGQLPSPLLNRHILHLQQLRCLELTADSLQARNLIAATQWSERLIATLAWL